MQNKIIIRSIAEKEIHEAFHWYEARRIGLGSDFILCVEEALEKIARNPKQYPIVHKNIRRGLIRRFPYGIFYLIADNRIVVLAVFHCSRDPKQWKHRS